MLKRFFMCPGVALIAVIVCTFLITMCGIRVIFANTNLNQTETIRKSNGTVLGYLEKNGAKTTVRDANNRILGYADQRGAYNAGNLKVTDGYLPGYLMCSGGR